MQKHLKIMLHYVLLSCNIWVEIARAIKKEVYMTDREFEIEEAYRKGYLNRNEYEQQMKEYWKEEK